MNRRASWWPLVCRKCAALFESLAVDCECPACGSFEVAIRIGTRRAVQVEDVRAALNQILRRTA